MRTVWDRFRHALCFEIIGLILVIPIGALVFSIPMHQMGVLGIVSATLAMAWNYIFNFGFDAIMKRKLGTTLKSLPLRIAHAVLFELGLLMILMPFIALYLGISLLQALIMDFSLALFYMVYAFIFNLVYDRVFPLPEWREAT
ncbi:PACE efflux transporter [Pelagibacterium sp.]|uniref:PACE efflux transporter n=1 Tax=Pelagibacterium sp. TaxID=1967288 RepID=UPI003A912DE1